MPVYPRPALPRLQFAGRFFADPSTINNVTAYYDVETFRPNYQLRQDSQNLNGGWNPEGTAQFALVDCKVTSTKTSTGTHGTPAVGVVDAPLLGSTLGGNDRSVQAKIADVDPQMQFASEVWGLRINIGTDTSGFRGLLEPTVFRDMWPSLEGAQGIPSFSATYQGVIKLSSFAAGDSEFLKECEPYVKDSKKVMNDKGEPVYPSGALSVRFVVNGFNETFEEPGFRYGDVTGIIQPWLVGEPKQFNTCRQMKVVANGEAMNAYTWVQTNTSSGASSLYVDLSNSLKRVTSLSFKDVGDIYVVALPDANVHTATKTAIPIGEIDYAAPKWLDRTGGIAELPLTPEQKTLVEATPLALVAFPKNASTPTVLLAEAKDGFFIHADYYVYRLNPAEEAVCEIFVTKFGQPAPGTAVAVGLDGSYFDGLPETGTPASALKINGDIPDDSKPNDFITTLDTDAKGVAALSIVGGDLKNPRGFIDGQLYGLRYGVQTLPPPTGGNPSDFVTILLFNKFEAPEKPSWLVDILPIFKQYANLYPSMDRIVSLDDYGSVVDRRTALSRAFSASVDDPHYMPVTRDMSVAKRDMIVKWLNDLDAKKRPLYMNVDRKEDLCEALQTAIELEHATIPPYLCALYSIKEGYNQFASDAFRDVVMEEMLHMALASNILIALGGRPKLNKIGFVPKYPGPLPGGLRRGLIVRLRKCSIEQLKAFMSIEAPEEQIITEDGAVNGDPSIINRLFDRDDVQRNRYTIGFLYDEIKSSIKRLHKCDEIKFPDDVPDGRKSDNFKFQVLDGWTGPRKLLKITTMEDALEAIDVIKEQGEGASPTNPTDGAKDPITNLPELSHYFRFAEIVYGRRLVLKPDGFEYSGDPLELVEDGIYNMQDDPNVVNLPEGSKARERMESFSRKYQAMLNGLHLTFNGQPDYLTQAVALMYQLTISAEPLMEMPVPNPDGSDKEDGTTVGLSFQVPFSD